jgi:hypothetical protein
MSEGTRWLIGLTVSVIAVVIAFLSWQYPKSAPEATPSDNVRYVSYYQIRAGDCITGLDVKLAITERGGTWPDTSEVVPCSKAHLAEVFFADNSYWKDGSEYPGTRAVTNTADLACRIAFGVYAGVAYHNSTDDIEWANPTAGSWAQGDRTIICMAYRPGSGKSGIMVLRKSVRKGS